MKQTDREMIQSLNRIYDAQAGGGGVTAVTGTPPIASSGGKTPAISIAPATASDPGSMSAADKTKLDGLSAPSGGVIGTASFNAVGGSISNLINDGVISGVGYDSVGYYRVDFTPSQPDANYIVFASLGGDRSDDIWSYDIPVTEKGSGHFNLEVRYKGSKSDASESVQVGVMRLSQ